MKQIAFMFPGQGSQSVGMGLDLYEQYTEVKNLFDQANEILGKDIKTLMFEGPTEELTKTENTQPALLLQSVAICQLLEKEGVNPIQLIGHSLGEYSALVAANVLTFEDALSLVAIRGKLMEEAFPKGKGSMAAVLGLNEREIKGVISQITTDEYVDIANLNCPGQIVISGTKKGIQQVEPLLKEAGARRFIELQVSGPFHSQLMESASKLFKDHLDSIQFNEAEIPVFANVTATPVTSGEEIKELLVQQLYSPVRFEESVENMIESGVDTFVEVGNGRVLSGLIRKINRNVKTFSVQDVSSYEKFIKWYKGE